MPEADIRSPELELRVVVTHSVRVLGTDLEALEEAAIALDF